MTDGHRHICLESGRYKMTDGNATPTVLTLDYVEQGNVNWILDTHDDIKR